jgi:hypothetical protein
VLEGVESGVIEMSVFKLSPAERRLIREQSSFEPSANALARLAVLAFAVALGTLLALHLAYVTVSSGGAMWFAGF